MTIQRLRSSLAKDQGLTLVEVLVATVITALVAITLFRLTNDATNSLTGTVNQVVSTNQIIGFTRALRSDVGSATDVYSFGENAPTDQISTNYLCSSWRTNAKATDWTDPTSATFVRPLVSLPVMWVDMSSNTGATPTYVEPTLTWVGYEIRANSALHDYELWRVGCYDNGGTANAAVVSQRMLVSIPFDNFNPNAYGTVAANSTNFGVMLCSSPNTSTAASPTPATTLGAEIGVACNIAGTSTATGSNADYSYLQFRFPYLESTSSATPGQAGDTGINLTTSNVAYSNSLTQLLTRKIGN